MWNYGMRLFCIKAQVAFLEERINSVGRVQLRRGPMIAFYNDVAECPENVLPSDLSGELMLPGILGWGQPSTPGSGTTWSR